MTPASPITDIPGVGSTQALKFGYLGIKTVADLINYYPRRYEDYSSLSPVANLKPGAVSIKAIIKQVSGRYVRRGMHITEAIASDDSGSVRLVWFNQPYRAGAIKKGSEYYISGKYELSRQRFAIMNPSIELGSDLPINAARILAVYKETKGLTSRQIRLAISRILDVILSLPESLPQEIIESNHLVSRASALRGLHVPDSPEELQAARYRLGFEEVFELSLASYLNRAENNREHALQVKFNAPLIQKFVAGLPFKLTDAQRRVCWQIFLDLEKPVPMNRLVEGDVGSGKTVVATMAAVAIMKEGYQAVFMAPTEILASQHAKTVAALLELLGLSDKLVLLTGSMSAAQKKAAKEAIKDGRAHFIVGTHALIQDSVDMHKLALVVIDEQHRFGVEQRKKLMAKAGHMPHVLSLTATPIPRSLALTLYGEMDISLLDEKPAGRQPVETSVVPFASRAQTYRQIDQQLAAGRQAFIVCPLISESDTASGSSVEKVYSDLSKHTFKARRVGLLHGKMKADEKERVMEEFLAGHIDILVSTTVIEVGVDVPNASVMAIESADRFGLAQLHQLRGRVGRGGHSAYCYLMLGEAQSPSRRLRALTSSQDGFKLAELDLELRGPGAIYGLSQHGSLDLRIANLTDVRLIEAARSSAQMFISSGAKLVKYPQLSKRVKRLRTVTNLN